MKALLPAASCMLLAGLIALPLRPFSQAQGASTQASQGAQPQGVDARVAALESELAQLKKRDDETRTLLEQTLAYLQKQATASQALLGALDESEKQGFAMGENWHSREILLAGLRAYLGQQQGAPKIPVPPPPPPAAPVRPVRVPRK